jgi:hypothetical protein
VAQLVVTFVVVVMVNFVNQQPMCFVKMSVNLV